MQNRRRLRPLPGWIVLAVLTACDGSILTEPDDGAVPFQTVYHSQTSGIDDPREQIVESPSEWSAAWSEIGRGGPPPSVDFDRDMVALVAAGARPNGCYSIEIRDIDVRGGRLRIDAESSEPGETCTCPQQVVHPVHAVRLRRSSRREDFDVRRVIQNCR